MQTQNFDMQDIFRSVKLCSSRTFPDASFQVEVEAHIQAMSFLQLVFPSDPVLFDHGLLQGHISEYTIVRL